LKLLNLSRLVDGQGRCTDKQKKSIMPGNHVAPKSEAYYELHGTLTEAIRFIDSGQGLLRYLAGMPESEFS